MDDQKNTSSTQHPTAPHDPHQDTPPPPAAPNETEITTNTDLEEPKIQNSSQNPLLASSEKQEISQSNSPLPPPEVMHSTVMPASDNTVTPPSTEKPNGGPKIKIIGAIAALVLLAVSIPAGLFLTRQSQDIRNLAAGERCGEYGEVCPNGKVQVCQKSINENGECVFNGSCSGCDNGAVCGNGACEPGEGADNCPADCKPAEGTVQCPGGLSPGQKKYDCTGNKAGCVGQAGEGVPKVCQNDGTFQVYGSECTNDCPVNNPDVKANCEYRDSGLGTCPAGQTKLCSGVKNAQGVCEWDARVSSCAACGSDNLNTCAANRSYFSGLLAGKPNPDPSCGANGGSYCNDGGNFNVCCYGDGNCYQGQQGVCRDLGNGTIELNATAEILEFSCPGQTSGSGNCSENKTSRGKMGPGTYSVGAGCGGRQIDAVGYCGSYKFNGACQSPPAAGGPPPTIQCLDIKIYNTTGTRIVDPAGTIRPGDTIRLAVSGNTSHPAGLSKARFRVNGGSFQETTNKNTANEYYLDVTVAAGAFSVEAQVFNNSLGWE